MPKKHVREFTVDELDQVAGRLRDFANKISDIAQTLKNSGSQVVTIKSAASVDRAAEDLHRFLDAAQSACNRVDLGAGLRAQHPVLSTQADPERKSTRKVKD
jgi:ABC-type transporter Mla subunit MlaD